MGNHILLIIALIAFCLFIYNMFNVFARIEKGILMTQGYEIVYQFISHCDSLDEYY